MLFKVIFKILANIQYFYAIKLFNKKDVVKTNMKTVEMIRGIGIIYVKGEMKFHLLRGMRK
ncbi:hypothetical protein GCM10008914_35940 [Clostridium tertium]